MKALSIGKNMVLRRGSGTLEILIAFSILILAITAAISVAFGNQGLTVDTELNHQAFYNASRELDAVRAAAIANFDAVVSVTTTPLNSTSSEGAYAGIYKRQLDVLDLSPCAKQVTSRITWNIDPLRSQKVEFSSIIVSTSTLAAMGGIGCSVVPPLDWSHPGTLGSIDLGPNEQGTDIKVKNKVVFISAAPTGNQPSLPDLFVVDADPGTAPSIVTSTNTGPGLNAIAIGGNYLYAAKAAASGQLQVIDISNVSNPLLITSSTLQGGVTEEGNAIFYYNSRIFIGTKADGAGPEFQVYDVSNPVIPVWLGSREIGSDENGIFVRGTTAYLATSNNNQEILALNVSNPGSIPVPVATNLTGNEDAMSLYLLGSRLYVGRVEGSNELYILNATNPGASLPVLGSKNLGLSPNGAAVTALVVSSPYAFLGTSDSNQEFQVFNILNPAAITLIADFNFPAEASGIDFENNLVYVSVHQNDALRIITANP
jgi:hypothetical protein